MSACRWMSSSSPAQGYLGGPNGVPPSAANDSSTEVLRGLTVGAPMVDGAAVEA